MAVFASNVQAALIEGDFLASGDGLLLLDTDTNLEWLDLTETAGLSYDDLVAGLGTVDYLGDYGFRFATTDEVGVLWTNAGVVDTSGTSTTSNRAGVEFLLDTMGCLASCNGSSDTTQGQAEFDPVQAVLNGPFIQLQSGGRARANLDPGFTQSRDFSSAGVGNYLVRNVVPEPSTALLFALGLAGLAARRSS